MNPTPAALDAFFARIAAVNATPPPVPEPFVPTPHGRRQPRAFGLTARGAAWRRPPRKDAS